MRRLLIGLVVLAFFAAAGVLAWLPFRGHTHVRRATPVQLQTEAAIAAGAKRNGVGYISTLPWFCAHPSGSTTDELCPLVVNHTITSIDRGHASKTYSLELVQPFRASFRRELFR